MQGTRLKLAASALLLASCAASGAADTALEGRSAAGLAAADREQARIAQSSDVQAMSELLHRDYTAHLPNGRLFSRSETLAFARSGRLAAERFERTQERVIVADEVGVVMGLDRLESPPPLATRGERTRRFTNIYVRDSGRWRLISRHFHFLP